MSYFKAFSIIGIIMSSLSVGITSANAASVHHRPSVKTAKRPPLVSAQLLAKASRVAQCEESGWHNVDGPVYYGAIGFLWSTWQAFRAPSFPVNMYDATPAQQTWALAHFVGAVLHYWPDQAGCTGGY